jgi:CobW/HypB/UreG, nucleotide-binding domain
MARFFCSMGYHQRLRSTAAAIPGIRNSILGVTGPFQLMASTIPITVFTGFLGAGKTSIILSLLPQLSANYRVVLLKNEFGDIEGRPFVVTCSLY